MIDIFPAVEDGAPNASKCQGSASRFHPFAEKRTEDPLDEGLEDVRRIRRKDCGDALRAIGGLITSCKAGV
jgi:hypothetical protein